MKIMRYVVCFSAGLSLLLGCSNSNSGNSKRASLSFNLPAGFGENSSLSNSCFAVNIIADDINSSSPGVCDSSYGVVGGLAPLGSSIELEAPQGSSRTIEILYVRSNQSCSAFDPDVGIGAQYGSNNVYRIGLKENVNFDQPVVEVTIKVQYPSSANSLASIVSAPASCMQYSTVNLVKVNQARTVNGAYNGLNSSGSHRAHIRVHDQKFDLTNPTNFTGRIRPVRLGEQ